MLDDLYIVADMRCYKIWQSLSLYEPDEHLRHIIRHLNDEIVVFENLWLIEVDHDEHIIEAMRFVDEADDDDNDELDEDEGLVYADNEIIEVTERKGLDDDEVEPELLDELELMRLIDEKGEIDCVLIFLELCVGMLEDDEDERVEVDNDERDDNDDDNDDEAEMLHIMDDDDEDEAIVILVMVLDTNEYLYLDIQVIVDIILLDERNMSVIDIAYIALLLIEL